VVREQQGAAPRWNSVEHWVVPVLDLGSALANVLPEWLSYLIADGCGLIAYQFMRQGRAALQHNLSVALGQSAQSPRVRRVARHSLTSYARMMLDTLRLRTMPLDELRTWIHVSGLEHIDAGLARGKGVILVAPHVGNWEPASNLAAFVPYRVTAVVDEGLISRAAATSRQRVGLSLVAQSNAVRPIVRALRQNEVVVLISDLVKDFRAAPVELFGQRTYIAAGPAHLALRTGATLVPIVSIRRADNRSDVIVEPPVLAVPGAELVAETNRLSQQVAAYFEMVIRGHPEQWYPFRPLWETNHEP
jgi:KDO2-lipid IV(A) lauroyltransferase